MNIDHVITAPLIRGLCIHTTKQPRVVIPESAGAIPSNALTVDLAAAWDNDNQFFDEERAGKLFQEAYTAWEFELSPAGVEAATQKVIRKKQPTCIAVTVNQSLETLYWIDKDIESAQKRRASRDDTPYDDYNTAHEATETLSADHRAGLVKEKVALVTGGAQGIGEAIVRGLVASGALVFIADINIEAAQQLANQLNSKQKRMAAIAVQVDVSDESSVEQLFKTVAETTGGLDICISNTGMGRMGSLLEQDTKSFEKATSVNYTGYFIVVKYCSLLLRRQNRTAQAWQTDIIQINAKSSPSSLNEGSVCSGGKPGSTGLTAAFALELIGYNIKVNAVCYGNFFDNSLWSDPEKGLFVQQLKSGKIQEARSIADVKAFHEAKVPMKRGCMGVDVLRAIYYIIEQEYETGQTVPVTGGQVMFH